MVLAEDTRRTGILLKTCGVSAKRFVSLHDHNEHERIPGILKELQAGAVAALVSDAGTPLLSDPGFLLVKACRTSGVAVSPVPGPSAPVAALMASGFPPLPFAFLGFPPRGRSDAVTWFEPYAHLALTLIFFERKDRLAATFAAAREALGNREACIAREITKTYEEFIYCDLDTNLAGRELLGEITVLLAPPVAVRLNEEEVLNAVRCHRELAPEAKPKEIARRVQTEAHGWSIKDVYTLMLGSQKDSA